MQEIKQDMNTLLKNFSNEDVVTGLNEVADIMLTLSESLGVQMKEDSTHKYLGEFFKNYIPAHRKFEAIETLFICISDDGDIHPKNIMGILSYLMGETAFALSSEETKMLIKNNSHRSFMNLVSMLIGKDDSFFGDGFSSRLEIVNYVNYHIGMGLNPAIEKHLRYLILEKRFFFRDGNLKNIIRFCHYYPSFISVLNDIYDLTSMPMLKKSILYCLLDVDSEIKRLVARYPDECQELKPEIYDKEARSKEIHFKVNMSDTYFFNVDLNDFILSLGEKTSFNKAETLKIYLEKILKEHNWMDIQFNEYYLVNVYETHLGIVISRDNKYTQDEVGEIVQYMLEMCATRVRDGQTLNSVLSERFPDKEDYE